MKIKKIEEKLELEDQFDVSTEACWNDCVIIRGNTNGTYVTLRRHLGYDPIDLSGSKLLNAIETAKKSGLPNCFGYRNASGNAYW